VTALVLLAAAWAFAAGPAAEGRFRAIAVYVDAGDAALGAYQVEISLGDSQPAAKIVGVEGGATASFGAAPYYDPAALQGGRIVIAAFTTGAEPLRGRTRVATLHVFEPAGAVPAYRARLVVAASGDGSDLRAAVTLDLGEPSA
jgi:hypothetical protein